MCGSSSSSKQTQESSSLVDESIGSASGGSSKISNVRGNVDVVVNTTGIPGADLTNLMNVMADAASVMAADLSTRIDTQAQTIGDIAKAATATQTETGQIIQRLAVPVIVLIAVIVLLPTLMSKR